MAPNMIDRSAFTTIDAITHLWSTASIPPSALSSIDLTASGPGLSCSFKVNHIARSTVALSALAAATIHAGRNATAVPRVTVDLQHSCVEFKSVDLWTLDGLPPAKDVHPIGGLHKTRDGYVRVVDSFPHLRRKALELVGLPYEVSAEEVRRRMRELDAGELEREGFRVGATIGKLRSFKEWDSLEQSRMVSDLPVTIKRVADGPSGWKFGTGGKQALAGVKVLDLSRVIAAPVAGKILAAHGADVLWVTGLN
jgi:hypothetical protein